MRGLGKKVAVCRPEREPSPGGDPADTPTLTSGLEKREDSRSVAEAAPSAASCHSGLSEHGPLHRLLARPCPRASSRESRKIKNVYEALWVGSSSHRPGSQGSPAMALW